MDIMDPYTSELLSAAALPGAFSGCAAAHQTEFDDDYLWAIRALPPRRPCADLATAYIRYPSTLEPPSVMLPAPCDLLAATLGTHAIEPTIEVSVPHPHPAARRKRAAPASDAATSESSAKRPRPCPWVPDYDADIDFNCTRRSGTSGSSPRQTT
jgi:hypothetical protein